MEEEWRREAREARQAEWEVERKKRIAIGQAWFKAKLKKINKRK